MSKGDKRVDQYIARAAPFAQPILTHLRTTVHTACPSVEEAIKWGHPFFQYQGMLCHMAAFKAHVAFGFWKAKLIIPDTAQYEQAMGQFGRITSVAGLPSGKVLAKYIKRGMELNDAGAPGRRATSTPKPPIPLPTDFKRALAGNAAARRTFDALPPSHRRDYLEWITEAKREATRERRIASAIELLGAGKDRNGRVRPAP